MTKKSGLKKTVIVLKKLYGNNSLIIIFVV